MVARFHSVTRLLAGFRSGSEGFPASVAIAVSETTWPASCDITSSRIEFRWIRRHARLIQIVLNTSQPNFSPERVDASWTKYPLRVEATHANDVVENDAGGPHRHHDAGSLVYKPID